MKLVLDTNILISALIKDSVTRELIINSNYDLIFPEFIIEEINNHKKEILKKSKLSRKEFEMLLSTLLKYVRIISTKEIIPFKQKAKEIIEKIDREDVIFIATALAHNSSIWSDDKDFQKQNKIKVFTTKQVKEIYESEIKINLN